jgi:tetratricopeptide (TPR) repeat protein
MGAVGASRLQLGVIYYRRGDLDAAKTMLDQALAIYEQSDDGYSEAPVYTTLGSIMLTEQKWSDAAECYHKALELSTDVFACGWFPAEQARIRHGLGVALRELGQHGEARKELEHALQLRIDAGLEHHPDMIATLHDLARLGLAASWRKKTEAWLAQADDHIRRAGSAGHAAAADHRALKAALAAAQATKPRPPQKPTRNRKRNER